MKIWTKISFLLCLCCFLFPVTVFASSSTDRKPEVTMTPNGTITWKTVDTKATTGITWKTEGFTTKTYPVLSNKLAGTKEYGNPIYKKPYGKITNKEEYSHLDRIVDGEYHYTWTIPKDVVDTQIKNAGTTAASLEKNEGKLYLNGFFRTYHNGKVASKYLYDLDSIKSAEAWKNPNDFKDRFDIPVPYKSQPVPVVIQQKEYYKGTYTTLKTSNQGKQDPYTYYIPKQSQVDLWELLPANALSKNRNGKKVWLYKVQIEDIKTGKTIAFPENNNYSDESVKKVKTISFKRNPITENASYMADVNAFRNRKWDIGSNGIRLVLYYKYYPKKVIITEDDPHTKKVSDDYTDPQPPNNKLEGVIRADEKGNEKFDVEQGIPTTEKTYSYVLGQEYLVSYTFTNYYGTNEYLQVIPSKNPKDPPVTTKVTKSYSYWKVTQLDVYAIDHATVENYALPNEKITLTPSSSYQKPTVVYKASGAMKEPVSGGATVENIQVQNDYLEINGKVLMQNGWFDTTAPTPSRLSKPGVINNTVLFKEHMVIDKNKENGEWDSIGTIVYKRIKSIGTSQGTELEFDFDVNSVVIHTPTVCDAQIEDVRKYNQLINPDRGSAGLVLDRYFEIFFPTVGTHNAYKGYGYQDYSKYIDRRQVQFPFPVYQGNTYIPANTWITIFRDRTSFYLPSWVSEGYYIAQFRALSINADANQGQDSEEELANYEMENYVAVDQVNVQVSGRVYDFQIYDITDYPLWQSVFRVKDSMELTGNYYSVGTKNRNGEETGHEQKMTLPLMSGSHPFMPCEGALPTGYTIRFSIKTMGDMYEECDFVILKPNFYYVSTDGTRREEVDLYYTETIHGTKRHLIKVGSEEDSKNTKMMSLGNPYTSVPEEELRNTANLLNLSMQQLKDTKSVVYSFQKIGLPWTQRTFYGKRILPYAGGTEESIKRSIQKWYGEYYLPAEVHAVSKGFPLSTYMKEHQVNYKESFWKKDGYIVVNFDITTIQNEMPHLSYENVQNYREGYCNMWKVEGYRNEKYDCKNTKFLLQDGDIVFYRLNDSVMKDYVIGGTH